jgi:DNA polymerase III alpha subunit
VIVWPEAYRRGEAVLHGDDPICLSGTLDIDEERVQVIADEIVPLAAAREEAVRQVHVRLSADAVDAAKLQRLRGTLAEHHGDCQAYLHLIRGEDSETIIALPEDLRVRPSEEMLETVERLFGVGVVHFQ